MRAASTIRLLERERGIARARALSASMVCVICGAQTRCGVWCERVTWRREMRGKTERTEAGCGLGLYSDFLRAKVPEPRAGLSRWRPFRRISVVCSYPTTNIDADELRAGGTSRVSAAVLIQVPRRSPPAQPIGLLNSQNVNQRQAHICSATHPCVPMSSCCIA